MIRVLRYTAVLLVLFNPCTGQIRTDLPKFEAKPEIQNVISPDAPRSSSRMIRQDGHGDLWIAAFNGVFKYDGQSFKNVGGNLTSLRFFCVLVDRQGEIWFGSLGAGVYRYDGKSFVNFTTKDGLINNEIQFMYEDKAGNIWFGVNGGVSRYDGKSFRNYMLIDGGMEEDRSGRIIENFTRPPHEITSILEDKTGILWFGSRDKAFAYDGKAFTTLGPAGAPFINVRSLTQDKSGDIWFGGQGGLWRYDGVRYSQINGDPINYVYGDKEGNVWVSSQVAEGNGWVLSVFDIKSLVDAKPSRKEIMTTGIIWGIYQVKDGSMWIAGDGVYRYDGQSITRFKNDQDR
jgi:ligand-binding sensor domain-containing protein